MTDAGTASGSVTLGFSDVVYTAPTRRWTRSKSSVRNVILNGVSGSFTPGTLTAIMGPSGAGKTSLLDILAGYKVNNVEGRISVNGAIREKRGCLRHLQSYTLQDDDLPPYITVEEAMTSAAALKLGPSVPTAQRALKVEDVLQSLGLSSCRKTFCCRISGGQRKRLSIALELISNPPIMFFDEPTSGLDSASCLSCVALLRSLARQGRTIVCTIHQPSSRIYDQFDQLYVLAVGVCVYRGSRQLLVPYLSAAGLICPSYYNPADFVIEVASGEFGDWTNLLMKSAANGKSTRWILPSSQNGDPASPDICLVQGTASPSARLGEAEGSSRTDQNRRCSSESDASPSDMEPRHSTVALSEQCSVPADQTGRDDSSGTKEVAESDQLKMLLLKQLSKKTGFPAPTSYQFQVLLWRTFKSILRNKMLTSIRLVSYVLFALLMGALYYRIGDKADRIYNNAAHVFFDLMFIVFSSLMPTILTFPLEMAVFRKEYMNGWYSVKAYYLAKTAADLPFQMAFPVLYTGIVYYLTGQPADWNRFAMFSLVMILVALLAQSVGLLIGACCSIQAAVFLGPVSMMPAILFCGFFINVSRIPVWLSWISLLSFSRYSFEALMLSLYGFDRHNLACSVPYCHFRHPDKFLQELSMDGADYWLDVLVLVLMVFVLRLLGYFVLRWKVGQER